MAKAPGYRLVSSVVTGGIFFAAVRSGRLALGVTLVDSVVKVIAFYLPERAWTKINFARDNYSRAELSAKETAMEQGGRITYELVENHQQ